MTIASKQKVGISDLHPDTYPIYGKSSLFEWDAIGTELRGQNQGSSISWLIRPKFAQLKDINTAKGAGVLQVASPNSKLTGDLYRESLTAYGPLSNEKPLGGGYGIIIDANSELKLDYFQINFDADNLYSKFKYTNIHYSRRNYNFRNNSGELEISKFPSITGIYGQKDQLYQIPTIYKLMMTPNSIPNLSLGYIGVDNEVMPTISTFFTSNEHSVGLNTFGFDNITASYLVKDLILQGTTFKISISYGRNSSPLMSLQLIKINL